MPRGSKPKCLCGECKACRTRDYHREYQRRRRAERGLTDAERQTARDRARRWAQSNRHKTRERSHLDRECNPEKVAARLELNKAIKRGDIVRRSCEVTDCDNERTQGHHEDYSQPLDVIWLCTRHHGIRHTVNIGAALAAEHAKVMATVARATSEHMAQAA